MEFLLKVWGVINGFFLFTIPLVLAKKEKGFDVKRMAFCDLQTTKSARIFNFVLVGLGGVGQFIFLFILAINSGWENHLISLLIFVGVVIGTIILVRFPAENKAWDTHMIGAIMSIGGCALGGFIFDLETKNVIGMVIAAILGAYTYLDYKRPLFALGQIPILALILLWNIEHALPLWK